MWIRLALAPLWVRVLAFVALSAIWAGIFAAVQWYQDGTLQGQGFVIAVIVVGVGASAVWSAVAVSQIKQRYGHVLAGVDQPTARAAALRAAFGGPLPTDPVVRRVATVLAAIRLQELGRRARRETLGSAMFVVLMLGPTAWAISEGNMRRAIICGVLVAWVRCRGAAYPVDTAARRRAAPAASGRTEAACLASVRPDLLRHRACARPTLRTSAVTRREVGPVCAPTFDRAQRVVRRDVIGPVEVIEQCGGLLGAERLISADHLGAAG